MQRLATLRGCVLPYLLSPKPCPRNGTEDHPALCLECEERQLRIGTFGFIEWSL